jgi:ketosteroid isomerase-like protein
MDFEKEAQSLWDTYARTMNDGDLDRWITLWDDDGIQMPPNCPPRKGKAAVLAAMRSDFRDYQLRKFTVIPHESAADRNIGYSSGSYTYVKVRISDGHETPIDGKFLTVFRKGSDGSWKIFRDCFNSNVPPR